MTRKSPSILRGQITQLRASLRTYKIWCASQQRIINRLLAESPQLEAEKEIARLEERCEDLTRLCELAELEVLYWLLGSSVQKQALRDGERNPFPACKHRQVGVESDVVTSILMLGQRYSHMMETLSLWLVC